MTRKKYLIRTKDWKKIGKIKTRPRVGTANRLPQIFRLHVRYNYTNELQRKYRDIFRRFIVRKEELATRSLILSFLQNYSLANFTTTSHHFQPPSYQPHTIEIATTVQIQTHRHIRVRKLVYRGGGRHRWRAGEGDARGRRGRAVGCCPEQRIYNARK